MKQHYLPKFYLEGFSDPATPEGHDPYIWIYDYENQDWKKRAPKNFGAFTDYYKLNVFSQDDPNILEKTFQIVESGTASVFENKIRKKIDLYYEDRKFIAEFVGLMILRIPMFQDDSQEVIDENWNNEVRKLISDKTYYEEYKTRFEKDKGRAFIEQSDIEEANKHPLVQQSEKDIRLTTSLRQILPIANYLIGMNWSFLFTDAENAFVTSDSPFVMINLNPRVGKPGLPQPGVVVTFPFSSEIALVAKNETQSNLFQDITPEMVETINRKTIWHSQRYIISSSKKFKGDEWISKKIESIKRKGHKQ